MTAPPPAKPPAAPAAPVVAGPQTPATHPLTAEEPGFIRLGNIPAGKNPIRVGVLLPFSNGSGATRVLAASMMKAAELALYDAGNSDILLISADEGSTPDTAAAATRGLLAQGAEVIVGPLFSQSAAAAAPIARDRAVALISFSTDKNVAGDGVYLLSFQPENEIRRVVSFALAHGHQNFAAIVPDSAYGNHISQALKSEVGALGGKISDIERLDPAKESEAVHAVAASDADAVLIAEGGAALREIAPALVGEGVDKSKVQFLGSGLWYDPAITRESMLEGGWFAAPAPDSGSAFEAKYKNAFGATPPPLAALAYDAVSLVALLASGEPYHRFTANALTDPSGFSGVNGIFRFNADGTSERGLAILSVGAEGFHMVDPAPRTFEKPAEKPPEKTSQNFPQMPAPKPGI